MSVGVVIALMGLKQHAFLEKALLRISQKNHPFFLHFLGSQRTSSHSPPHVDSTAKAKDPLTRFTSSFPLALLQFRVTHLDDWVGVC